MSLSKKRIFFFLIVFIILASTAILVIKLAQGYKPDFSAKTLRPTGLLVATSIPDGAQVFIDGKLKSATNTTLSLSPDEYEVEIKKDGYTSWKKRLVIKKELVTKTDGYLFSSFPDLRALTFTGASNPLLSPDGLKVVYAVDNASVGKQGLWVLDLTDRPLGLARDPRQIIAPTSPTSVGARDFSKAEYVWSPDSKQILVTLKRSKILTENFLLDTDKLNLPASLVDVTPTLDFLLERWEKEKETLFQVQLSKLPPELLKTIDGKVKDIHFAPDETKIMYIATASASIPEGLTLSPLVASTQPEERKINPGRVYVYDLKEDKNFFIIEEKEITASWFPTSKHIFLVQSDKIIIIESDGTNKVDIYTGPFVNSFAFPFPAGNRFLVLTSIGKDTPANLYAVTLR